MYHAIWPEGLPEQAFHTTSHWKAFWYRFKRQGYYQLPWNWSKARRMRWSTCAEGPIVPTLIEQGMERDGCQPPPDGWPKPIATTQTLMGDVSTHTCSVI